MDLFHFLGGLHLDFAFEEKDEEVLLAVMALPAKLRESVLLYFYQDMSVKEIAQALSVSTSAVSARLNRAKRKLRIALERRPCHG